MRLRKDQARVLWLVCLLWPGISAHATEPDPGAQASATETAAMREEAAARETFAIERAREALAAGDPRRAMIATVAFAHGRGSWMESVMADDPEAIARKARLERLAVEAVALAQARGAEDPVVQLQLSGVCDQPWANCDADAAVERLAALEPENGLAALIALRHANRLRDAAGEQAAVQALAAAGRFESHEAEVLAAARAFVAGGHPPVAVAGEPFNLTPDDRRAMVALTLWLVAPTTGLIPQGLDARCRATPKDADERAHCIAAARVLAGGDALVGLQIGLALLQDLVDDPDERARVRGLRRDLDWQASAHAELTTQIGESPGSMTGFVDAQIEAGGEIALRTKLLSEAGIPLTAPADWTPSNPRLRD